MDTYRRFGRIRRRAHSCWRGWHRHRPLICGNRLATMSTERVALINPFPTRCTEPTHLDSPAFRGAGAVRRSVPRGTFGGPLDTAAAETSPEATEAERSNSTWVIIARTARSCCQQTTRRGCQCLPAARRSCRHCLLRRPRHCTWRVEFVRALVGRRLALLAPQRSRCSTSCNESR